MTKDELATLKPGDRIVVHGGVHFFIGVNRAGDFVSYETPEGRFRAGSVACLSTPTGEKIIETS